MRRTGRQAGEGERGIALLLVLWILALLSTMAVCVRADSGTALRLAHNRIENAQARALADAGLWRALGELTAHRLLALNSADGRERRISYAGGDILLVVQDESGKIDLNAATAVQLERLFLAVGIGRDEATLLTQAAVRYRDDVTRARRPAAASSPAEPAFGTRDELRLVRGMTPAVYARVAPYVTVHNGDRRVNPYTAPKPVLLALPGVDRQGAQRAIDRRSAEGQPNDSPDFSELQKAAAFLSWRRPRIVSIRATATTHSGARSSREAIVDLFPGQGREYRTLSWRRDSEP